MVGGEGGEVDGLSLGHQVGMVGIPLDEVATPFAPHLVVRGALPGGKALHLGCGEAVVLGKDSRDVLAGVGSRRAHV